MDWGSGLDLSKAVTQSLGGASSSPIASQSLFGSKSIHGCKLMWEQWAGGRSGVGPKWVETMTHTLPSLCDPGRDD